METKNTVYILRSDSNQSRHYTGLTSDLEKRLKWHNAGPRRFEKYLKSGSGREFAKRHFADIPIT